MNNTITVKITSVFGNRTVYPICDNARLFALLAGTKTLTETTINYIKKLGYTINVETQVL